MPLPSGGVGLTQARLNSAIFVVASLGYAALVVLPAGELRLGDEVSTFRLTDLLGLGYFLAAAAVILLVLGLLQMASREGSSPIAAWGFWILSGLTMVAVLLVESVGRFIPRTLLPTTLRRFVLNLGVTAVPWVALVLCIVAAISAHWGLSEVLRRIGRSTDESERGFRLRAVASAGLFLGLCILAISRNQAVAEVSFGSRTVEVEPWAIPYLGPGSLLSILLMLFCAVAVAVSWRVGIVGAVGAGLAWVSASVSGLIAATSGLVVESGATRWVFDQLAEVEELKELGQTTLTSSASPWFAYVGALIIGSSFVVALAGAGSPR